MGAVVSLDSTVEHNAVDDPGFAPLTVRLKDAMRLAGPIMTYASKEDKPNFLGHWGHWKYTRLYTVAVSHLEHNDFVSQGATRFAFLPGRRIPPERAAAIRAGYDRVCLFTRNFFDAHLKGDREAGLFLKRAAQGVRTDAAAWDVSIREPSPVPPTAGQLVDLVLRDGLDEAMGVVRRFGPEIDEETLRDAADALYGANKPAGGMVLLRRRCELYPNSWIAQKFLAEQLLDDGDRAGALAGYRKAQELIASGAKPEASDRARKAIAAGLKKAEGK